jgi:hypothetical protein
MLTFNTELPEWEMLQDTLPSGTRIVDRPRGWSVEEWHKNKSDCLVWDLRKNYEGFCIGFVNPFYDSVPSLSKMVVVIPEEHMHRRTDRRFSRLHVEADGDFFYEPVQLAEGCCIQ